MQRSRHIGVDEESNLIHSLEGIAINVYRLHTITGAAARRGNCTVGDSCYQSVGKQTEMMDREIWFLASIKLGNSRALPDTTKG